MGRKKKSSSAGEGSSETGDSSKSKSVINKQVIGADYVETNGTVTIEKPKNAEVPVMEKLRCR